VPERHRFAAIVALCHLSNFLILDDFLGVFAVKSFQLIPEEPQCILKRAVRMLPYFRKPVYDQ
jgi:hypothetical protein